MEENKQIKENSGIGIVSFVLGIIAIMTSFFVIPSVLLAIASIITGIIALVKKSKKVMPVVGIVLSSIGVIISAIVITIVLFVTKLALDITNDIDLNDEIKSGLTQLYNDISKGITDELNIENKLDGYSWEVSDGSLLELNDDGRYYWYKNAEDKTDNYYTGTYKSYLGDSAIEKIDNKVGFNEEAYEKNFAILRTDIYYLELQKQETVINGKKTDTIQKTQYALFFYNANTDKCEGMNLNTQNLVYFTKAK